MSTPKIYNGGITREQFLYFEMRIISKYKLQGYSNEEILKIAYDDNILEMPTEKSIGLLTRACLRRLDNCPESLTELIANASPEIAKQANLYAMMCQNLLVWEFMINVIGKKFAMQDLSFSKKDVNVYLTKLKEQQEQISTWSESTFNKIRSVLIRILTDTGYLDNIKSEKLNPVYLFEELEEVIIKNNDEVVLPAFNRFI
jgi:hypothetical protein